jgi:uncharacterized protein (DUF433 family)
MPEPTERPLYTVSAAHRLAGVNPSTIRRWLEGYAYDYAGERRFSPAKVKASAGRVEDTLLLNFLDLIEVQTAARLRHARVGWKAIAEVLSLARSRWSTKHPFAIQRLRSDGRQLFVDAAATSGSKILHRLGSRQLEFEEVVDPSLFELIDFTEEGEPLRWWLQGRNRRIVVDPARAFGQPIIAGRGVPVVALVKAFSTELDANRVARLFGVAAKDVEQAVKFGAHYRLAA